MERPHLRRRRLLFPLGVQGLRRAPGPPLPSPSSLPAPHVFPNPERGAGPWGCVPDCGVSSVATTAVTITVEASYRLSALVTTDMQAAFLARSSWNLCFAANSSAAAALEQQEEENRCWWPEPRRFASAVERQEVTLALPDADWEVRVSAPFGAVTGAVTVNSTEARAAAGATATTLASWGLCKPRASAAAAAGAAAAKPAARRSVAVRTPEGQELAGSAVARGQFARGASPARASGERSGGGPQGGGEAEGEECTRRLLAGLAAARGDAPAGALARRRGKLLGPTESLLLKARRGPHLAPTHSLGSCSTFHDDPAVSLVKQPYDVLGSGVGVVTDSSKVVVDPSVRIQYHPGPPAPERIAPRRHRASERLPPLAHARARAQGVRASFLDLRSVGKRPENLALGFAPTAYGPDDVGSSPDSFDLVSVPGCLPGADFWTVVKVPPGASTATYISWNITSEVAGGKIIASSLPLTLTSRALGSVGSGYSAYPGGETWWISRWCAPSAEALRGPVTVALATDPAAPAGNPAGTPLPTLVVLDRNRCRAAPRFPLLSLAFPAPGARDPVALASAPSLVAPDCSISSPKELEPADPLGTWSYPMMVLLGSKAGADFTGYLSADSVRPGPADPAANASACGPGYAPVWFLSWFPQSSDSVPWRLTLLQRSFPFFGIQGVDDLSVGLTPLQSFDTSKRDGLRLPNPLAAQRFASPSGDLRSLCVSFGVYEIAAVQAVAPHRPGRFVMASPAGCHLSVTPAPLTLSGASSEAGALGYFVVGSRSDPAATPYNCSVVIDTQSARRGWDGCQAAGGSRVYALGFFVGVYHASDVSWRAEYLGPDPAAPGDPIPTLMAGGNYSRNRNTLERWCVRPGLLRVHAYDNNAASAANASRGWDGAVAPPPSAPAGSPARAAKRRRRRSLTLRSRERRREPPVP